MSVAKGLYAGMNFIEVRGIKVESKQLGDCEELRSNDDDPREPVKSVKLILPTDRQQSSYQAIHPTAYPIPKSR